jgi:DNA-binding NtrC family response regulator
MASPAILLVDDDVDFLTSISKLLGYFGYVVAGAANSEAAMNYVAHAGNRFDVIVTDLAMPKIDGLAFMTAAKQAFPDVPVIVVTGHSEQCTATEALRLGAFAYLTKPFNTQELVNTIERAQRLSASARNRLIPPSALAATSRRDSPSAPA